MAFILPGLHRVVRGAEIAFESIATELARLPEFRVTLFGSGYSHDDDPYSFKHAACVPREFFRRWPRFPMLRSDYAYEELSFITNLLSIYRPGDFDLTVGCSYPFVNWIARAWRGKDKRPAHIYVTQNGEWPLVCDTKEYRFFDCEGVVCTNPEYYQRHQATWPCSLIPNGVDSLAFQVVPRRRDYDRISVLVVSALIPSKRVLDAIRCVSRLQNSTLTVAGDGPMAAQVDQYGRGLLGDNYKRLSVPKEQMPSLYQKADVLLHMSVDEPFGNIFVEASACGTAVVAHNGASMKWILEDTAFLVDTLQDDEVVAALQTASTAYDAKDIARRRDLVDRRYAWPSVAAQYAAFLKQIHALHRISYSHA